MAVTFNLYLFLKLPEINCAPDVVILYVTLTKIHYPHPPMIMLVLH